MKFIYLKGRFRGDGIDIWSCRGIFIKVGNNILKLDNWEDARELMYRLEDIYREALLFKKKMIHHEDLILGPEDDHWLLIWHDRPLRLEADMARSLVPILRFFVRRYHKLMLDYKSYILKEGFEVEVAGTKYSSQK